jgi:TRAP-type C4-dicarboxylate transport system permease small subunit
MIDQGLYWIAKALLVLASFLAFLLSFVVVTDVIGRVAFNSPLQGTPELVSSSIVIICYLQAVYAILSGGMMHVDAITRRMPARIQGVLGALACILGIFLFSIIFWGSIDGFIHALESGEYEGEGALRVPMWPVRLAVLVGSGLAVLAYILMAARQVGAARRNEALAIGASH